MHSLTLTHTRTHAHTYTPPNNITVFRSIAVDSLQWATSHPPLATTVRVFVKSTTMTVNQLFPHQCNFAIVLATSNKQKGERNITQKKKGAPSGDKRCHHIIKHHLHSCSCGFGTDAAETFITQGVPKQLIQSHKVQAAFHCACTSPPASLHECVYVCV